MNVDIFALYIFSRHMRFSNIRENMYTVKITFHMLSRGNAIKNANISPHGVAHFHKFPKIHTRENIYVYSSVIAGTVYCVINALMSKKGYAID